MMHASYLLPVFALSALGCAAEAANTAPPSHTPPGHSPPDAPAATPLPLTPLKGPFPTPEKACEAAGAGAPCVVSSIPLAPGTPFSAALLRAEDKRDPRYAGSGTFLLSLGGGAAWFVTQKPLDQMSGAAGQTYLPVVQPAEAKALGDRVLFRFSDAVTSICNVCEGPERDKKKPVKTLGIVVVCARLGASTPLCSAALEIDEKAAATLGADGVLSITPPGGPTRRFSTTP